MYMRDQTGRCLAVDIRKPVYNKLNEELRSVRYEPSKVTRLRIWCSVTWMKILVYLSHPVHSLSFHRTTGDVCKIGIPLTLTTINRRYAQRQTVWGLRPELLVFVYFQIVSIASHAMWLRRDVIRNTDTQGRGCRWYLSRIVENVNMESKQ